MLGCRCGKNGPDHDPDTMSLFYRTILNMLHRTRLAHVSRPVCRGAGVIFMLHRVRPRAAQTDEAVPPADECGFFPNAELTITPEFLDAAVGLVKQQGYELVRLNEVPEHLQAWQEGGQEKPFAAFTLDDAYRDVHDHAWPVFRRHDCPFTIFVSPALTDGESELWWEVLEEVIRSNEVVRPDLPDIPRRLNTASLAGKRAAWEMLYPVVRYMDEYEQRDYILRLGERHGVDAHAQCRALVMDWNALREMVADPLCDIGAHGMHHRALARLHEEDARYEMAASRAHIESELETRVETFAYPYGDPDSAGPREFRLARELGFRLAVTTRKGHLYPEHLDHLTALPRLSLNGYYQDLRQLDVLLTGLPFLLYNRLRRLDVA